MTGDWIRCSLADVCESVDYGYTASANETAVGPHFLRITDIVGGDIDWESVPYVDADSHVVQKYMLTDGDIVVARTGASTGASAYVSRPPVAVFASYLVRLKIKRGVHPRYVAYYLKSRGFQSFIRAVLGDKSAQPNASASTMVQAPFRAPKSLGEQRAIAHILGTLDDKIELNRRMNATLEGIARAIFKSWFVDFDPVRTKAEGRDPGLPKHLADLFPDRFVESELGQIPEGWRVRPLDSVLELAYGKALRADEREAGTVPVFGSNGQIGWHSRELVPGPGIIVGRKGNPGVVTWSLVGFHPIDTTFYVMPKLADTSMHYLYHALKLLNLPALAADSAVPGLNQHLAYMTRLTVPSIRLTRFYDQQMAVLSVRAQCSAVETTLLASLRDTLLPKLISGELRVPEAERIVGEHT